MPARVGFSKLAELMGALRPTVPSDAPKLDKNDSLLSERNRLARRYAETRSPVTLGQLRSVTMQALSKGS